jgi:hypothetical protein
MKAPEVLLAAILVLAVSAGGILVLEGLDRPSANAAPAREYQELVGGLGFGPALDLSRCVYGFDPRLCAECEEELGPIAGGAVFCPRHAGSVLYYPPLPTSP